MRDFMNCQKQIMVHRPSQSIRNGNEQGRIWIGIPQRPRGEQLNQYDSQHNPLCEWLMTHEFCYLFPGLYF